MIIKGASVYTKDHEFVRKDIITDGILIRELCPSSSGDSLNSDGTADSLLPDSNEVVNAKGLYAIPGLVDIHFHGAMGHDFCDASSEGLKEIA